VLVVDAEGRPVPEQALRIVLDDEGGSETREVTSDLVGRVILADVPPEGEVASAEAIDSKKRVRYRPHSGRLEEGPSKGPPT